MGYNGNGQLGDGTTTDRHLPIQIVSGTPAPIILGINLAGANLVINGSNGLSGGIYYTLMSTNTAKPLNQWLPIATNVLGASGSFTITVTNTFNIGALQRYYILLLQ